MTPLELLRADLAHTRTKLLRIQGKSRTQLHVLDLIGDILELLQRYATAVDDAGVDPPAAQALADVDVAGSQVPLAGPQPPASPQGKH